MAAEKSLHRTGFALACLARAKVRSAVPTFPEASG